MHPDAGTAKKILYNRPTKDKCQIGSEACLLNFCVTELHTGADDVDK